MGEGRGQQWGRGEGVRGGDGSGGEPEGSVGEERRGALGGEVELRGSKWEMRGEGRLSGERGRGEGHQLGY